MRAKKWDGKVISTPGLYSGVPLNVYHSQNICDGPSVSSTSLRRVLEVNGGSPAHFFAEWSGNPERVEANDSKAFMLGRAAHHLLLGVQNFATLFQVSPFDSYRTKEAREWRDDLIAKGVTPLRQDDVTTIRGMAQSLGHHPLVREGVLNGMIECSGFWRDKQTGLWIKMRPDAIPSDSGDFADLKTTSSVQYGDLVRSISDFGYHQQAALVREGAKIVLDLDMASFTFVFVETKPPYCTRLVQLKDDSLVRGNQQNHSAMRLIARCIKEKRWPGPGDERAVDYVELSARYKDAADMALADEKRGT